MKYLLIVMMALLTSCATTKTEIADQVDYKKEIIRLEYYIAHDKCFTSYAVCMVDKKQNCWTMHEQCVIAVYRQYKPLLD